MKGFEVTFRGKTVKIAVNEPIGLSVLVQKVRGKIDMHVAGCLMDNDTHPVWMLADDLKEGDEIVIKRKEVEERSPPLLPPADYDPSQPPTLTPDQLHEMWQGQLKYFRTLESFLQKEGLIPSDVTARLPE